MRSRLFVLALLAPVVAAAESRPYWIEPAPVNADERALREALVGAAFGGPDAAAVALARLADAKSGTTTSGLERLAAGLALLDVSQPHAALLQLRHPDVQRTALADHALFGIGQAGERLGDPAGAAEAYLAAADAYPGGPIACVALFRAAETWLRAQKPAAALPPLERALAACPGQEARTLLQMAEATEGLKDLKAAAALYDRLDREYPASSEARGSTRRLASLQSLLPSEPEEARRERSKRKAAAFFETSQCSEALLLLRALVAKPLEAAEADALRLKLGRCLISLRRTREAEPVLLAIGASSESGAEAAFLVARLRSARAPTPDAYEAVASRFPESPWAEESLLALANYYQKDARDDEALPYYRRLLASFPDGRYADRSGWRVGWGEFRLGRYPEAAQILERTARLRPSSSYAPGLLYWAGRARKEAGETQRARLLLEEVVRRYRNAYHGARAREGLTRLPKGPPLAATELSTAAPQPQREVPEPTLTRVRQLLLIDRFDAAYEELRPTPPSSLGQATMAWLDSRRGRLRPAIVAMKRAYPEWVSEAGESLPPEVWRILFPLQFGSLLQSKAAEEGLDASLVAGLICQESTFDAGAVSPAGARGLMQVIPPTGRSLARALKVKYSTRALHDPAISLDFGTRYLRQMMDRFEGRTERVLAAYNAGPHRVDAWTLSRPGLTDEEFVESIPFTETRSYVMTVLNNQQQYRRLYGLAAPPLQTAALGGAP